MDGLTIAWIVIGLLGAGFCVYTAFNPADGGTVVTNEHGQMLMNDATGEFVRAPSEKWKAGWLIAAPFAFVLMPLTLLLLVGVALAWLFGSAATAAIREDFGPPDGSVNRPYHVRDWDS